MQYVDLILLLEATGLIDKCLEYLLELEKEQPELPEKKEEEF